MPRGTRDTPNSLECLRKLLSELLAEELGTLEGGFQAIHVTAPELLNQEVNGILCVIERYPHLMRSRPCIGVSQVTEYRYWRVTFRQYNRNVIPVQLSAPIAAGATTLSVQPLQGRIAKGGKINFSSQTVTVAEAVTGGQSEIALTEAAIASTSAETGLHDPMVEMDSLIAKMKARFRDKRERYPPLTEEGEYPQVTYLLDFVQIINLCV